MLNKDINYYINLPYTVEIKEIHDGSQNYFYARVHELDGCQSDGKTEIEARKNIHNAMLGYIETKLEFGDYIPEPRPKAEQ